MGQKFTRRELYDLVWSEPMRTLATRFGISDVALAKTCGKADIPIPYRGYWNRKQASKPAIQTDLSPRFPGASDLIEIGKAESPYRFGTDWRARFLQEPVPDVPAFDEEMSAVRARVTAMVGKIKCPPEFEPAHPLIAKLLAHDVGRREYQLKWNTTYDPPKYESGIERRRLLILNGFFLSLQRLGCRPDMVTSKYAQDTRESRNINVKVGQVYVPFTLEPLKTKKDGKGRQRDHLQLALGASRENSRPLICWDDTEGKGLEKQLSEIVAEILVTGEELYRESLVHHRAWFIEQRAEAEKELQRRREEQERKERERREREAKERIDRLLSQANALHQSDTIRVYVEKVRSRLAEIGIEQSGFQRWSTWALAEADRIDPVRNGTIKVAIESVAVST